MTDNRRINPLVDRYVTTDIPLAEIIRNSPTVDNPCTKALLLIAECLAGKRLAKEAIAAAESAPIQSADAETRTLLLCEWAELSCRIGRPSEAQTLLHQAKAQITEKTHPVIRGTAMLVESALADATGDQHRRETLLRESLDVIGEHAARRKFHLWELALLLATQGRGNELTGQLRELTWQCNEHFPLSQLMVVQFINAVETGHLQEASQHMTEITTSTAAERNRVRAPYAEHQSLLTLMHASVASQGRHELNIPRPDRPVWAQVVYHLLTRDSGQALTIAQLEARRAMSSIFGAGFSALNLVRAELACRHPEAALRLLNMRHARGNEHYLDDFFMARAEHLSGNQREARHSFQRAVEAVDHYDAKGRLDFELRLATELTQSDIVALSKRPVLHQRSDKKSDAPPPPPRNRRAKLRSATGSTATAGHEKAQTQTHVPKGIQKLLGRSLAIQEIQETIQRYADLDAPVLITGETGTGKDLVAQALHEESERRNSPYVAINCGTITESLLESELFGHEKGAFTGADRANRGLFEEALDGTIFLDEIGEISPRLQMALLRVLESGEIRAIGSTRTRTVQCRIIAATHAPLQERIDQRLFRQDLMYRLERLCIRIPPLRERQDDVMLLARHFLDMGRPIGTHCHVSKGFIQAVRQYPWPGNVRELRNVIERMRLTHSDKLSYSDQDLDIRMPTATSQKAGTGERRLVDENALTTTGSIAQEPLSASRATPQDIHAFLKSGNSLLRRTDRLRALFKEHRRLTRSEIVQILGIAPNTATKYLKALCEEGFVRRIEPNASTRTHYFECV
ncbi:MAG: sigma 54-interacting transcriptional regulator [Verrucomicrobia bacterium]|nr:sigma 54-interacting transcriptional regulator [Verrucomicrobiota bacterium]